MTPELSVEAERIREANERSTPGSTIEGTPRDRAMSREVIIIERGTGYPRVVHDNGRGQLVDGGGRSYIPQTHYGNGKPIIVENGRQITVEPNDKRLKRDRAMIQGGIDFASKHLHMETSGDKINITFNPAMMAQFERGDFSGVKIQILDVVPISLMPLLGLKEDEGSGQLAKA